MDKVIVITKVIIQILTLVLPIVRGIRETIRANTHNGSPRRKYTTRF